jgi:hypothetical protein
VLCAAAVVRGSPAAAAAALVRAGEGSVTPVPFDPAGVIRMLRLQRAEFDAVDELNLPPTLLDVAL